MMRKFNSKEDFYAHYDEVVEKLREQGLSDSADKIYYLLHKVFWTTTSELFGELRLNLYSILGEHSYRLSEELQKDIEQCAADLEEAFLISNGNRKS